MSNFTEPKIVVFGDYSANSGASLDVQVVSKFKNIYNIKEFEQDAEYRIQFLLREIEDGLYEETIHTNELVKNQCSEWKLNFPHLGVFGKSIQKKDDNHVSNVGNECTFGGVLEDVIESHGDFFEYFAKDCNDIKDLKTITEIRREKRAKKKGFPPIEPLDCVKNSVYSILFDGIWKQLCLVLQPLLNFSSTPTSSHNSSQNKEITNTEIEQSRIINEISKRTVMKPTGRKVQNIQFGLDEAIRIRPYTVGEASEDENSEMDKFLKNAQNFQSIYIDKDYQKEKNLKPKRRKKKRKKETIQGIIETDRIHQIRFGGGWKYFKRPTTNERKNQEIRKLQRRSELHTSGSLRTKTVLKQVLPPIDKQQFNKKQQQQQHRMKSFTKSDLQLPKIPRAQTALPTYVIYSTTGSSSSVLYPQKSYLMWTQKTTKKRLL